MKKILFILTVIFFNYNCYSQQHNNNWILGDNLINFNNSNPSITLPPTILGYEAGARSVVSDKNGDLLFYLANDNKVYNKEGGVIFDLNSVNNYSLIQNSVIIPNPIIDGDYIIFYTEVDSLGCINCSDFTSYKVIHITFNDPTEPLGKTDQTPNLGNLYYAVNDPGFSSLSTIKKANNDGYFVILGGNDNGNINFNVINVNKSSTEYMEEQFTIYDFPTSLLPNNFIPDYSVSKINLNGDKLAFILGKKNTNNWYIFTANINASTGAISGYKLVKNSTVEIKDIEFASSSDLLYSIIGNQIIIHDVSTPTINESVIFEQTQIEKSNLGKASNGKIYFLNENIETNLPSYTTTYTSDKIYYIENSNSILDAYINPNFQVLPNKIQYTIPIGGLYRKDYFSITELVPELNDCSDQITTEEDTNTSSKIKISADRLVLKHNITSTANGNYLANNSIILSDGFHIKQGALVSFEIKGCNNENNINNDKTIKSNKSDSPVDNDINLIKVYPNPADGYTHIDLSNFDYDTSFDIYIYDINGKLLLRDIFQGDNIQYLDLNNFKKGVYIIKIVNNNYIYQKIKLIKK